MKLEEALKELDEGEKKSIKQITGKQNNIGISNDNNVLLVDDV